MFHRSLTRPLPSPGAVKYYVSMDQERRGIAGGGSWIIDRLYICDRWPHEETLDNILSEERGTGGAPYNCLLEIARFGPDLGGERIPLEAIGLIGDDANGRFIQSDCADNGIDTSALIVSDKAPTSYTNVMVIRDSGKRTFFHNRGANALFGVEHVPVERIKARMVHFGYLLLLDGMDAADADSEPPPRGCSSSFRTPGSQPASMLSARTAIDFPRSSSPR